MNAPDPHADEASPGLAVSLGNFLGNLSALLGSRAELAAIELGELRDNLVRLLLVGAAGMLALLFALGCWTALVVVLGWDRMGWTILLLVALAWSLGAFLLYRQIRALLAPGKLSLPLTMDELRKDRDALLRGDGHA
ncbi:phage holin family protein [Noviherbaspirillum aridicola]|uniref:Membrane protein YqjE n=1 Tax=Noviherbaspirillum aridicola TaxID=2849687 RepID=A0ABQ4Q4K6_9BURK|nr:phage holin family protein [Noviherbaspirillum aridicola]GIZ51730.1 hypothetical protein NCCP691_17440 [Noviherbaspirillum aridicola]